MNEFALRARLIDGETTSMIVSETATISIPTDVPDIHCAAYASPLAHSQRSSVTIARLRLH
jgi:hypothetical protein